jgi:hypothetical protein
MRELIKSVLHQHLNEQKQNLKWTKELANIESIKYNTK